MRGKYLKAVKDSLVYLNERADSKSLLGELDREPSDFIVHLNKVSHTIEAVYVVNCEICCVIRILNTDNGKNVRLLLDADLPIYLTPRFIVDAAGIRVATFDLAIDPPEIKCRWFESKEELINFKRDKILEKVLEDKKPI